MGNDREIREKLPFTIPHYSFHGDRVSYEATSLSTPGRTYLDPQEILVRVYNSTIAVDGGFSGEVMAIGDYVDSVGVNEYVIGGGLNSLQPYITVKAEETFIKPADLSFADASRLHAGTLLYEHLRHLQQDMTVLIIGDMTGFASQICRERGCFVTSTDDFHCGEQNIIESDNYLEWLENHDFIYDVVVDASGDLDIYDHCHKFTTKRAEYISINPESTFQAVKSSLLPRFLGGGTRKLTIVRPARGQKKAQLLRDLATKIVDGHYEVKNPRIVSYRSVSSVHPVRRYVTAVNVVEQKDLTPEGNEEVHELSGKKHSNKGKGKAKTHSRKTSKSKDLQQTPEAQVHKTGSGSGHEGRGIPPRKMNSPTSPIVHPYSPRISSRLAHSVSASALPELSPSPTQAQFQINTGIHETRRRSDAGETPKISMVASPPRSRRQTNDVLQDHSPFDQIELQTLGSHTRMTADSGDDDESDTNLSAPIPSRYLSAVDSGSEVESDFDSDAETHKGLLQQGARRMPKQAPVSSRTQPTYTMREEDTDVSDVEIDRSIHVSKAEKLRSAQEQIEFLQKQVADLKAAQKTQSPEPDSAGLGLLNL